jgi:leader peptidase (prepilin peptidase) / N-methyltransferase
MCFVVRRREEKMQYYWIPILILVGLVIGSFINVVIYRIPLEKSITSPSMCPNCSHKITMLENIPILSYLLLGGKCRYCQEKISIIYPMVEIISTLVLLFALLKQTILSNFELLYIFIDVAFILAVVTLIFINYEHLILPNVITLPSAAIALAIRLFIPNPKLMDPIILFENEYLTNNPTTASIISGVLGLIIGAGTLFLIREIYFLAYQREIFGLGDVKMMLMVGAYLGWILTICVLIVAFVLILFTGIFLFITKDREKLQLQIPSGLFWGLPSIILTFFGKEIISLSRQFF